MGLKQRQEGGSKWCMGVLLCCGDGAVGPCTPALLRPQHIRYTKARIDINKTMCLCWCCRFSIPIQLDSVAKLLQYDWLRVLPGHGRPAYLRDAAHRLQAVSKLLQQHNHATDAVAVQQVATPTKAAVR